MDFFPSFFFSSMHTHKCSVLLVLPVVLRFFFFVSHHTVGFASYGVICLIHAILAGNLTVFDQL